ncbi:CCA tRNA nucleotidyltransferase [bacterium]|nr:CCA tRNA nucleotidyltransferase [bacterium]
MRTAFTIGISIIETLRAAGFESYFAGGCVRDMIMNISPEDYDIATAAPVSDIQRLFKRTVPVGVSFGVILVIEEGIPFQVAAFRGESRTAEEDALKRDFTVNGLFYDHVKDRIIDFVGGKNDIAQRTIRAIGSPRDRFSDDYLRMLRAIRIAVTRGCTINRHTFSILQEMAPSIRLISIERIRNELILLFSSRNLCGGLELLLESRLFDFIFPEYCTFAKTELDFFESIASQCTIWDLYIGFACFVFAMEQTAFQSGNPFPPNALSLLKRLLLPADTQKAIMRIAARSIAFKTACETSVGTKKKWMQSTTFLWELAFHRAVLAASNKPATSYEHLKQLYGSYSYTDLFPQKLLSGEDLIRCGFKPDSRWSRLFEEMELLQLDGILTTREQAENWVNTFLA